MTSSSSTAVGGSREWELFLDLENSKVYIHYGRFIESVYHEVNYILFNIENKLNEIYKWVWKLP